MSSLLRKVHPAQEVLEAGVGAQGGISSSCPWGRGGCSERMLGEIDGLPLPSG